MWKKCTFDEFSRTLPFVFCKHRSGRSSGTHPRGKPILVSHPARSLCRNILRFAAAGIFEHKFFFFSWYELRSTYSASVLRTTKKLKAQFRSIYRPGTHPKKSSKLEKSARPSSGSDLRRMLRPAKQCPYACR